MEELNTLSVDLSNNVIQTQVTVTSVVMTERIGMWGSTMFGDVPILGAGGSSTYLSNHGKNVLALDISLNVI